MLQALRGHSTGLASCLARVSAEDEQFDVDPLEMTDPDPDWKIERQRADIVHRLLGLVTYAANPRNIELSDLPYLASTLTNLCAQAEMSGKERR